MYKTKDEHRRRNALSSENTDGVLYSWVIKPDAIKQRKKPKMIYETITKARGQNRKEILKEVVKTFLEDRHEKGKGTFTKKDLKNFFGIDKTPLRTKRKVLLEVFKMMKDNGQITEIEKVVIVRTYENQSVGSGEDLRFSDVQKYGTRIKNELSLRLKKKRSVITLYSITE